MNIQYLGNHAERLTDLEQLNTQGEIYVVGRSRDAFIAFRLPQKERVKRKFITLKTSGEEDRVECDEMIISGVQIYEAILYPDGSEIQEGYEKRNRGLVIDKPMDIHHMGVFRPTEGSKLRKILEEKLPIEELEEIE
jgi:hypothetical protein